MASGSGQKYIGRNRAPRVQIEYDVELYGAERKIELPFVMGVLSDLRGKSTVELQPIDKREMLEVDGETLDNRMAAIQPRIAFAVQNRLTGEGNLMVDMTFEKMEDFSPGAIAQKDPSLKKLLDTRAQLSELLTYMDGKTGAEELLGKLLKDPDLMKVMSAGQASADTTPASSNKEQE